MQNSFNFLFSPNIYYSLHNFCYLGSQKGILQKEKWCVTILLPFRMFAGLLAEGTQNCAIQFIAGGQFFGKMTIDGCF